MEKLENQYYMLLRNPNQTPFLALRGTKDAGQRRYKIRQLEYDDGPVFFENALKGEMPFYIGNAQMDGIFPVVSEEIAEEIGQLKIDGFQLFPAVIVGDDDQWHEAFYFFNCYRKLDCVDFSSSLVRNYDPNDIVGHEVLKYKLKEEMLLGIEEENRLIIKLDNVVGGAIIVHEKLVSKLEKHDVDAFLFYKLSEYELGTEYKGQRTTCA
ncbi:hypothetical protein L4C34_17350 [Vibrio profundum]|uniref:imm11 family protein n=1 Tax=Vibrio profundum TaxID=2910247 RepID=UPI003D095F94